MTRRQWLQCGWQHLFRQAILKRFPAGKLAAHFDPEIGRRTEELNSMDGYCSLIELVAAPTVAIIAPA